MRESEGKLPRQLGHACWDMADCLFEIKLEHCCRRLMPLALLATIFPWGGKRLLCAKMIIFSGQNRLGRFSNRRSDCGGRISQREENGWIWKWHLHRKALAFGDVISALHLSRHAGSSTGWTPQACPCSLCFYPQRPYRRVMRFCGLHLRLRSLPQLT